MRGVAIAIWLLLPFGVAAYHYGPGQEGVVLDRSQSLFDAAQAQAKAGDHALALESWDGALEELSALPATPERTAAMRRARLERCKSALLSEKLPEARHELMGLLEEVEADPAADRSLAREVRAATAQARFYYTWLQKLEGFPREEWGPEIEASRQSYALLAETAGDAQEKARHQADLEAAVRLELQDPEELQGLPIPKQCQNCNCEGKKPGRSKKPGKKPGKSRGDEKARGAGAGPPADGGGS